MKILGPNETGKTGILVEYDGFISPQDERNSKILAEAEGFDYSKDLILFAILQKSDTPNRNGRIYPDSLLKRETKKYEAYIKKGSAISELNHPESTLIDLDRVSHSILKVWWDGKMMMGEIKIITSPGWKKAGIISCKGDQAANLLLNGVTLGISSRGVGSLKRQGDHNVVQDDFDLVCFDLVSSPSTPGAYLIFDLKDREKYDESIEQEKEEKTISELSRTTKLMGKLNNFLSK